VLQLTSKQEALPKSLLYWLFSSFWDSFAKGFKVPSSITSQMKNSITIGFDHTRQY
jgi:hypothetical protein